MSGILIPRLLALDSATLGKLAADYFHESDHRRNSAREFLSALKHQGLILSISFEHLAELLRHQNDDTVVQRLMFLQQLEMLAWVKPTQETLLPGSCLDIDLLEVRCVVEQQKPDHQAVVDSVRQTLWQVGGGGDLIGQIDTFWDVMREAARWLGRDSKKTASIARSDPGSVRNCKLREIDGQPLKSLGQYQQAIKSLSADMTTQITQHGDKKLSDADAVARNFYEEIQFDMGRLSSASGDALTTILSFFGMSREDVTLDMTIGEVSDLWHFRQHLKLLQRRNMQGQPFGPKDVLPEQLPSWTFRHQLSRAQNMANRVEGSNLIDTRLAGLALYTEFVEVDKRTAEYLRQLKRRHSTGDLLNLTFRCSNYPRVIDAIRAADC